MLLTLVATVAAILYLAHAIREPDTNRRRAIEADLHRVVIVIMA
jgi:hypothetical protein